jgi:DNA-binding CsgD family transcriptional regulator
VVKHEAFAVAKANGRAVPVDEALEFQTDERAWTEARAERYERLRLGAEAMAGLKPQEIRCLLLKAEGLSYQEICQATGFSYTKVNRALTEGRRAFLKRVAGIEAGAECERLVPLISKLADGEASPDELRIVRPHLKGCLACKATLREYRAAPGRIAGLVPPVAALAGGGGGASGLLARLLDRFPWVADRIAAVSDRFTSIGDAPGAKVAAVAASAAVIAGGGAAGIDAMHHDAPPVEQSAFAPTQTTSSPAQATVAPAPLPTPSVSQPPDPSTAAIDAVSRLSDQPATSAEPAPAPEKPKQAEPTPEFDPGTTTGSGAGTGPQPTEFGLPTASQPKSGSGAPESTPKAPGRVSGRSEAGAPPGEFGP